jgi:hypothetical protein
MNIYSIVGDLIYYVKCLRILNFFVIIDAVLILFLVVASFVKKDNIIIKNVFFLPFASINIFAISFIVLKYIFSTSLTF